MYLETNNQGAHILSEFFANSRVRTKSLKKFLGRPSRTGKGTQEYRTICIMSSFWFRSLRPARPASKLLPYPTVESVPTPLLSGRPRPEGAGEAPPTGGIGKNLR